MSDKPIYNGPTSSEPRLVYAWEGEVEALHKTIDRLRNALEQISLMPDPQDEWDGLAAFRKAKRLARVAVAVSDADRGGDDA